MQLIVFKTKRLIVRHLNHDDYDMMYSIYRDPEGAKWVGDGQPITAEDCEKWIDITQNNYKTRGYGMFALYDQKLKTVIGFGGIVHPGGQKEPEIKYSIKKELWGQGYATEAVKGLIKYGSSVHAITHFIATVAQENLASQRVLEKAGMVQSDIIKEADNSSTLVFSYRA